MRVEVAADNVNVGRLVGPQAVPQGQHGDNQGCEPDGDEQEVPRLEPVKREPCMLSYAGFLRSGGILHFSRKVEQPTKVERGLRYVFQEEQC